MCRFRSFILGVLPGGPEHVRVLHEDDGSCCKRESWNQTAAAIVVALQPPVPTIMVNRNSSEVEPC
jgi:hypothetical protein